MTVSELRDRLLGTMSDTNATVGAENAPAGIADAIRALPDVQLLRRLPAEISSWIERLLASCTDHKRDI